MFTSPYPPRMAKAGYAICVAITLLVIALWITGPIILEHAYYGNSLSFFNTAITGQNEHPLSDYISMFYGFMVPSTVIIAWVVILLVHMIWRGQAHSQVFTDRTRVDSMSSVNWVIAVSCYSVLILGSIFVLIVFHGNTYFSDFAQDTFVYFDGSHRLNMGQVPHKDFHTPLGVASYLITYLGFLLKGSYAGSLELASFFVAVAVTLFAVVLLRGRSSAFFAVLTIAFLSLLTAIPVFVGSPGTTITHGGYYNRWAWVSLTLIYITYIAPKTYSNSRLALEALMLAFLITFLFFLKVTYFVFALMFLFVLASASHRQRLLAISAGVISVVLWALIEWRLSVTGPYIEDLRSAIAVSGAVQRSFLAGAAANSIEYLLIIAAFSILMLKRVVRWLDFLFVAFVGASGLAILNQNSQYYNVVVILAVLLWGYAVTLRRMQDGKADSRLPMIDAGDVRIMGVLLVLFITPRLVSDMRGIYSLSMGVATGGQQSQIATLQGVYIGEPVHIGEGGISYLDKVHAEADPILLFNEMRYRRSLSQGDYIQTINEGVRLLDAQRVRSGKIVTFDLANPFNFLTGGPPSEGDYSWFHRGRNISQTVHVAAPTLFRDVKYIMVPTFPVLYYTTRLLWEIYGEHVKREYVVLATSKCWTLYGRPE